MWGPNTNELSAVNQTIVVPVQINNLTAACTPYCYPANLSTLTYTIENTLFDFQNGMPYGGDLYVSEWVPSTSYTYGAYLTHTFTAGELASMSNGGVWVGNSLYQQGDLIYSGAGIDACIRKVWKVQAGTSGTTSGVQPTWKPCNLNSNVDGTLTWRDLDGGMASNNGTTVTQATTPVFTYQLTGISKPGSSVLCGAGAIMGTVNTAATGNTVTWETGTVQFLTNWVGNIVINSVTYTIATVPTVTSMTLTTSPGNQTGVSFTLPACSIGTSVTSGGSLPAFVPITTYHHPDLGLITLDTNGANTLYWTNVGPSIQASFASWGGSSHDDRYFSEDTSTNTYGTLTNKYNASGGQDSGFYAEAYDATNYVFQMYNLYTGIQTKWQCTNGACASGATQTTIGQGTGGINWTTVVPDGTVCEGEIHNMKSNYDGLRQLLTVDDTNGSGFGTTWPYCTGSAPTAATYMVWYPFQAFNATTTLQQSQIGAHYAGGNQSVFGHKPYYYSSTSGGFYGMLVSLTNPTESGQQAPPLNWQAVDCSAAAPFTTPNCNVANALDDHFGWPWGNGTDSNPVCGTSTNANPIGGDQSMSGNQAWVDEVVCVSTAPTYTPANLSTWNAAPTCQVGNTYPVGFCSSTFPYVGPPLESEWRFTHTFNMESNAAFNIQFSIAQVSQDAKYIAWGTDEQGLLGDTTGAAPTTCSGTSGPLGLGAPTGTCTPIAPTVSQTCMGGNPYRSVPTAYVLGTLIDPIGDLSGSGSNYGVFQAVQVTGNSTGTIPNTGGSCSGGVCPSWNTAGAALGNLVYDGSNCTVGNSCANGVIWEMIDTGLPTCRGEVFVVKATNP
jgi:hypothetical protein